MKLLFLIFIIEQQLDDVTDLGKIRGFSRTSLSDYINYVEGAWTEKTQR